MWYFISPKVAFGEGAVDALDEIKGSRALIVTDPTVRQLGLLDIVCPHLETAGLKMEIFDAIEPDPSTETVLQGTKAASVFQPDWIIAVGGGSVIDAAKAIWVLYERPDLQPGEINPLIELNIRQKARFAAVPTTSGTGSEATWGIVLTDTAEKRKMGLGNREAIPDLAVVDPAMAAGMPPKLTAATGLDVLTHAIEGYTSSWHNDFSDGPCLVATRLAFRYLARAVKDGSDREAREHMHNAATCAGLGFSNSLTSLAHTMGHALGAAFHVPHGRAVGLFLPYTIEYCAREDPTRYAELAQFLGCTPAEGAEGALALANALRSLARQISEPLSLKEAGIEQAAFEAALDKLVDDAFNDTSIVSSLRAPDYDEFRQVFIHAYEGKPVDF